jgi:nucleotide-binding universal stress UspA family protein
MRILAATDFSTRSLLAVRRAGLLTRDNNAELALLHVVDDDQPKNLVEIESHEAQRYLEELTGSMAELRGLECQVMVVPGDAFSGILQAAKQHSADLIVMGAHRKQLLRDIFVGTTIERVIRTSRYPVLMVNTEVGQQYKKVMVAVDMSEPSAHAIRTGKALGLVGNAALVLVHAFNPAAEGKMSFAGIQKGEILDYVASEQSRAGRHIAAFLKAHGLADDSWTTLIEKGEALDVITNAVQKVAPDLLLMGTRGRSGIVKILLGSVTESVLRSVNVDILAVPPVWR